MLRPLSRRAFVRLRPLVSRLIPGLFGLALVLAAGSQATAQSSSASLPAEKLDLKVRLQQGRMYHQTGHTTTETRQGVPGREQVSRMQTEMGMSYQVEAVDAGAETMDVRMTYDWVKMRVVAADAIVDFDSRTSKGAVHPMARMFSALVGQGFGATLDANGRVVTVRELALFRKALVDKIAPVSGPERDAVVGAIAQQFGIDSIRTMLEAGFVVPDRPIAVGESWRRKMPSPAGTQSDVVNAYTLRQRKTGVATIDVAADLSVRMAGATDATAVLMTGTQVGQLIVDEATGWTTAAQFVQQMAGASGGVPVRIKTTVALTGR